MHFYKLGIISLKIQLILCVFTSVNEFKREWNKNERNQLNWVRPTRSAEFEYDNTSTCLVYGSYDFVIVGGGVAGSVLAARLSEIANKTVLLLEAGGDETDYSLIPAASSNILASDMNWGYLVEPQSNICKSKKNNQCSFVTGRALGGSSAINGLGMNKGNKHDFNSWKYKGWSFKEILPYFIKSENATALLNVSNIILDLSYHGFSGPIYVSANTPTPPLADIVLQGLNDYGLQIRDINGRQQIGASLTQNNVKNGRRFSMNQAYLQPIKNQRDNLKILTKALGIQILFQRKTAVGVQFITNHTCYNVTANNEVIIAGGVINSPQILLQSGVGPKDHLKSMNIDVKFDLPVGSNLRDQIALTGINIDTNQTVAATTFEEDIKDYLRGVGELTYIDNYQISFLKLHNAKAQDGVPDYEVLCRLDKKYTNTKVTFKTANLKSSMKAKSSQSKDKTSQIICSVVYLQTKSIGSVRLRSNNTLDYPVIDPRYLSTESDRENFIAALLQFENILKTDTFKSVNAQLKDFGISQCSKLFDKSNKTPYWKCIIKNLAGPFLHAIGTCPMGRSARDSVVDENLRVHGAKNLMVVDASVIPVITSGHTMQPVVAIAEKISDAIKKQYA